MSEQGYLLKPLPKSNPETQQTQPNSSTNLRSGNDALPSYVDRMLNEKRWLKTINTLRIDVLSLYSPIAAVALTVIFYLAHRTADPTSCQGKVYEWILYGLIFYSITTVDAVVLRKALRINTGNIIANCLKGNIGKSLRPWFGIIFNMVQILLNIGLVFAFLEKDKCPALNNHMLWWAGIQFIPFVGLLVSFGLTCFTMVHYLEFEKRRLA